MTIKVIPLPALQGLKFDVVLPDGYIVTMEMDDYQIRQYRGSIADVIEAKVLDWLDLNGYTRDSVAIIYC